MIELAERKWLPDWAIRRGIRYLLRKRLQKEILRSQNSPSRAAALREIFARGPIAIETTAANEQHYEVPTELFQAMLGSRLKYSGCYWKDFVGDLAQAEEAMLGLTCQRAKIEDGQRILDLGCGWGSLSLWLA
ncbi:MAG: class I SAM-dependent methyltransferase, partial [Lacipirellulaceae bacterium]